MRRPSVFSLLVAAAVVFLLAPAPSAQPEGAPPGTLAPKAQPRAEEPERRRTANVDTARAATAQAAETRPSFRVRTWTLDDGLPAPIAGIAQTPDGYLWIATAQGLARFDGVRFDILTAATTPVFDSTRFRPDDFAGVFATRTGDLWLGDHYGRSYRLRDGVWTTTLVAPDTYHPVTTFTEALDGTVWAEGPHIGFRPRTLTSRFDGQGWTRAAVRASTDGMPLTANAGGVWTTTGAGALARWNGERFVPSDLLASETVATAAGPLVHRRTPVAGGRTRVDLSDATGRTLGWFWDDARGTARVRLIDRAERLWVEVADAGGGQALAVVRDGVELDRIAPEGAPGFSNVFEDREGSVWATAQGIGLLHISETPFQRITLGDGIPPGAEYVAVFEGGVIVSQGSNARSAAGAPSAAVVRDGVATSLRFRAGTLPDRFTGLVTGDPVSVGAVTADRAGRLWGALGSSLVRIDNGTTTAVFDTDSSSVHVVYVDPAEADVVWVGDTDGLVVRYDVGAAAVTASARVGRAGLDAVFDIHGTPDGRRWVASSAGVAEVLPDGSLWQLPDPPVNGPHVIDLETAPDGTLWGGTDEGLVRIREGRAELLRAGRDIPADRIQAVLFDDAGWMWLAGRRALYRLRTADADAALDGRKAAPEVATLLPSLGHLGASNRLERAARADDGSLWIPSARGVTRIDPALYARQRAATPPVVIEHVTANGQHHATGHTLAADVRLGAEERDFEIDYTVPVFVDPDGVRFQYQLAGYDDGWVEAGTRRQAFYTGVPPGTYTFRVRARNSDGVWSEAPAAVTLRIAPFFYETWWFRSLCAALVFALLSLAVRARTRRIEAQRRHLQQTVDEQTQSIREQNERLAQQAERLREVDRLKSRFFANVSHEFRTPLTLTIGPLEDLQAEALPAPSQQKVDLALRNSRRLLRLIGQLLDIAKLEAGELRLHARRHDLAAFVRDTARSFVPLAERRRLRLTVETSEVPMLVSFDMEKMEQVLANLLSNAFKFTPEGGAIHVSAVCDAHEAAGHALITVRDNGPGIAPEALPHLFERFYRADETHAEVQPGTGIGLSLAKDLVELHGGTITVESTVDFGTTFTVRLPGDIRLDEPAAPDVPAITALLTHGDGLPDDRGVELDEAEEPEDDDRTTILVADDNAEIRAYVRSHLGPHYRVIEAADGAEALARTRAHLPDLVLSDVMMPHLDGLELVAALRADRTTDFVPVILLTARAEEEDKLAGLSEGADAYLTKPFSVRELLARVENILASRQRLKEHFAALPPTTVLQAEWSEDGLSPSDEAYLVRVQAIVEAHLSDEAFSVEELATALEQSRSTLHRRLKDILDQTPTAFVREIRLQQAAVLFRERRGTVSEVAYAVGFKSVSHFSQAFRSAYGATPSAYLAGAPSLNGASSLEEAPEPGKAD